MDFKVEYPKIKGGCIFMGNIKIVIDAGHGLYTAGKRCMKSIDKNETREWVLNARIADKLEKLLSNYNCEILRVDDKTGNKDISLSHRVKNANSWKADVYISIHHNAGIYGGSGGGTVIFYYSSKEERKEQTQRLYNAIVNKTGLVGNRSTKIKKYAYYVIKKTDMPAFLIENGFMDSKVDVPILLSEEHADKTAQGILDFLVNEYKLEQKENKTFKVKIKDDVELNIRDGAGIQYKINGVIKDHGVYTIVKIENTNWGKLKSGAGWISIHEKYVDRLE